MSKYKVSFRIVSKNLTREYIDNILGMESDIFHAFDAPSTMWSVDSCLEEKNSFEIQIEEILNKLAEKKENLYKLYAQGAKADFFCGYFDDEGQPGFDLSANILRRMGELNIDFLVFFYDLFSI